MFSLHCTLIQLLVVIAYEIKTILPHVFKRKSPGVEMKLSFDNLERLCALFPKRPAFVFLE